MKNRKCPLRKHCYDHKDDNCNGCEIGDEITKLHKRIDRLKKQKENLTIERNAWYLTAKAIENKWIPVEERLPEELTHVIVHEDGGTVGEAWHYKEGHFEWMENGSRAEVTHWMPIPEPPKGVTENEKV